MSSTMLLLFFMITIVCVAMLYQKNIEKYCKEKEKVDLDQMDKQIFIEKELLKVFSFPYIIDSKFIGLVVFLISNLLTGFVNLSMNTLYVSGFYSFLILCAYNFMAYFIPFMGYYYFYCVYNKKKAD